MLYYENRNWVRAEQTKLRGTHTSPRIDRYRSGAPSAYIARSKIKSSQVQFELLPNAVITSWWCFPSCAMGFSLHDTERSGGKQVASTLAALPSDGLTTEERVVLAFLFLLLFPLIARFAMN